MPMNQDASNLRNICIVAHVDHGKTTLVDHILRQTGGVTRSDCDLERIMDSQDLERERGITIQAKNAAVSVGKVRINIVDTPGHADFSGEVERILCMADGAILLVDAAEGPLPQTRFVLEKSLHYGHKIILFINKVDRQEVREDLRRIENVVNEVFDLFIELGATEEQAEFSVFYGCARDGWCTSVLEEVPQYLSAERQGDLTPLFHSVIENLPSPQKTFQDDHFRFFVADLRYSDFLGQLAIGKILNGSVSSGQKLIRHFVDPVANEPKMLSFHATKLFAYEGLNQEEVTELSMGNIAVIAGCPDICIGDSFVDHEDCPSIPSVKISNPTLKMTFAVNDGPLSGRKGKAIQSRKLRDLFLRETKNNVALEFEETENSNHFFLLGRGELQFAVLIENFRRRGFEFLVGRPQVLIKEVDGVRQEPYERTTMDLPKEYSGTVTELLQSRKGVLLNFLTMEDSQRVRLIFNIPTRGLIGIRSRFLSITRGQGLMNSDMAGYKKYRGDIRHRKNGAIVADKPGKTTEYALYGLQDRGELFVHPGTIVYEGMIIGENNQDNNLNVNAVREKKLTNVRKVNSDGLTILDGIRKMSLERCIEWIDDDEWIEVTPESIRLRKKVLNAQKRSVIRNNS